jgi:hypothetical protein
MAGKKKKGDDPLADILAGWTAYTTEEVKRRLEFIRDKSLDSWIAIVASGSSKGVAGAARSFQDAMGELERVAEIADRGKGGDSSRILIDIIGFDESKIQTNPEPETETEPEAEMEE